MAAQQQLASDDDPEGIAATFEASVNTVPPLQAARACEWSLHDHLRITGAPLLDLMDDDNGGFTGGANDDEAGPAAAATRRTTASSSTVRFRFRFSLNFS